MSGPWSRPVSARRSGRNKARPFAPVAAFTASVSAPHGSASQSSDSTAAVAAASTGRAADRKSAVSGKSVSVRVDLGGRRIIKKKTAHTTQLKYYLHKHHKQLK